VVAGKSRNILFIEMAGVVFSQNMVVLKNLSCVSIVFNRVLKLETANIENIRTFSFQHLFFDID
jgi:hypothetical protein